MSTETQTITTPRSHPLPEGWPMWEGHRHLETLNQYLERMAQEGHTEFRVSIQDARPVRGREYELNREKRPAYEGHDIRFIIHPLEVGGVSADFEAPHGGRPETSPGMTAYNVEPLSHGMNMDEWAAKVRDLTRTEEDDGDLYDYFAQGYAVEEMPGILADREEERLRDFNADY